MYKYFLLILFSLFFDNAQGQINIRMVGDCMIGTSYPSTKCLPPTDSNILVYATEYLKNADITFGNLEGCIYDEEGVVKKCNDPSKCYAFKIPNRYSLYFQSAGFDVLNLANNHSGDFGPDARLNTVNTLSSLQIGSCGLLDHKWYVVTVKNKKLGFIGFSPNSGTLDINDIPAAQYLVKQLDSICDIVIVSLHTGAEGGKALHVKDRYEFFYGENRGNPVKVAHSLIDAGADMIIGHGPHVPRAIDCYKGKFIAYSLGNFATFNRFSLKGYSKYAPMIDILIDNDGNMVKGEILSFLQYGEGIPIYDDNNLVAKLIRKLTKEDIKKPGLKFQTNGTFIPVLKAKKIK
ncbi:MAG: CapA family protein [Bacteroidota bacterium]|nr:CapA family protein [Bacteroidota bacterium]